MSLRGCRNSYILYGHLVGLSKEQSIWADPCEERNGIRGSNAFTVASSENNKH